MNPERWKPKDGERIMKTFVQLRKGHEFVSFLFFCFRCQTCGDRWTTLITSHTKIRYTDRTITGGSTEWRWKSVINVNVRGIVVFVIAGEGKGHKCEANKSRQQQPMKTSQLKVQVWFFNKWFATVSSFRNTEGLSSRAVFTIGCWEGVGMGGLGWRGRGWGGAWEEWEGEGLSGIDWSNSEPRLPARLKGCYLIPLIGCLNGDHRFHWSVFLRDPCRPLGVP